MFSHALLGHILWGFIRFFTGVGAVLGAQFGVKFSLILKAASLTKYTAYVILIMGLKFIYYYISY